MINLSLRSKIVLGLFVILLIQTCQTQGNSNQASESSSDARSEVEQVIKKTNDYYKNGDMRWVDSYDDTYTVITDDGRSITQYADSLRNQWKKMTQKYNVVVREPGEPTIIASDHQALHYNTASEMFINKATNDTMDNTGTWIALWKKQKVNSWKIVLETYQARPTE